MKKHTFPQVRVILTFSLVLFYYELLFQWSTLGKVWDTGTIFMAMLCVGYSCVGYLLSTLFKKRKINRIFNIVCLFVTALPYLIEYFVYKQFKILYDMTTVFSGASDALQSYYRETLALIFSWGGLLRIFLYFLPGILFIIFGRPGRKGNWTSRLIAVGISAVMLAGAALGISCNERLNAICTTQYSFESAVDQFGLLTGIGLDTSRILFKTETDFVIPPDIPDVTVETTAPEETDPTEPEETQPVYVPNVLDLDLDDPNASGSIAKMNKYIASLTPSMQNEYTGLFKGKNLVFITAEAFAAEVIDPELTPTLYRLATKGIQFTDFYQLSGAGTTGGEYQNVFGMLPSNGGSSFKNTADNLNYYTIGSMLDREGYYGQAFHNNSYTYYDRHKTHINLGYSEGFMGYGNGMEEYVQNLWPQSDLEMLQGTLPTYIDKGPFNVYYMSVSGHSGYSTAGNSMTRKNWDRVQHLNCSNLLKGYFAAQLELEDALTYLVEELEKKGIADDTVICISADHFPYGLDDDAPLGNMPYLSELYGYDVDNAFDRDHNRLILWCGSLEDSEPIVVDTPTFSLDILPTLANLFGVEYDSRLLPGRDVFSGAAPLVFSMNYSWISEFGIYNASTGKFTQTKQGVTLPDTYVKVISSIVGNKISYCDMALDNDYFRYLFG